MSDWRERWLTRRNLLRFVLVLFTGIVVGLLSRPGGKDGAPVGTRDIHRLETPPCDPVQRVCHAIGDSLSLSLRLPGSAGALKPFPVTVHVRGGREIDGVTIAFTMTGMDMGNNRYRLQRQPGGRWTGRVLLPVCTTGRKDWQADVEVADGNRRYQARFRFTVE